MAAVCHRPIISIFTKSLAISTRNSKSSREQIIPTSVM